MPVIPNESQSRMKAFTNLPEDIIFDVNLWLEGQEGRFTGGILRPGDRHEGIEDLAETFGARASEQLQHAARHFTIQAGIYWAVVNCGRPTACIAYVQSRPTIFMTVGMLAALETAFVILLLDDAFSTALVGKAVAPPKYRGVKADFLNQTISGVDANDFSEEHFGIGYGLSNLAYSVIVLHEIGHLVCGHLSVRKQDASAIFEGDGSNTVEKWLDQAIEMQADLYAFRTLADGLLNMADRENNGKVLFGNKASVMQTLAVVTSVLFRMFDRVEWNLGGMLTHPPFSIRLLWAGYFASDLRPEAREDWLKAYVNGIETVEGALQRLMKNHIPFDNFALALQALPEYIAKLDEFAKEAKATWRRNMREQGITLIKHPLND
jgi:hypothetical protein